MTGQKKAEVDPLAGKRQLAKSPTVSTSQRRLHRLCQLRPNASPLFSNHASKDVI